MSNTHWYGVIGEGGDSGDRTERAWKAHMEKERKQKEMDKIFAARMEEDRKVPQRVAHETEEGYKERFVPSRGWVQVTPDHIYRVSLRLLGGSPGNDEIVLAATMTSDEESKQVSLKDQFFEVKVHPGETAAEVEKNIWRMQRINSARVAIELLGPDGTPLPADGLVMESFPVRAYFITLSFLRRSSSNSVILLAATLADSFELSVADDALVKDVATKIHADRVLDGSVVVKIVGLDGVALPLDESMSKCLSLSKPQTEGVTMAAAVVETSTEAKTSVSRELSRQLSKHLSGDFPNTNPRTGTPKPGRLAFLASCVCCSA